MKFEYFEKTDTLYIDLKDTPSANSQEMPGGIVLDFDEKGNITGIEIDNAKKIVNLNKLETKSLPLKDLSFA